MENIKHMFLCWPKLKNKFKEQFIFLFLDYDGTLTPIVDEPDKAVIPEQTKRLLENLTRLPRCKVGIISGRELNDIKEIINLKEIIYVGNHGLQIDGPKLKFEHPVFPGYKKVLAEIKNKLKSELSSVKGVLVEDKGLGIAFHYRLVNKAETLLARTVFQEVVYPYKKENLIKVKVGKMVLEVRPPVEWGKGEAVLWLLARQQFVVGDNKLMPIYMGDDKTDEDAFVAIKDKGLSIFVGEPDISNADYYLKNSQEVTEFLNLILKELKINAGVNKSQRAV